MEVYVLFLQVPCWASSDPAVYLRMRDALGVMYQDSDFAALFSSRGQPAEAPARQA
jgi:hypothetical protein